PSVQSSNFIACARESVAATGRVLVARSRQAATAHAAAANRIIRSPPTSGPMPERPPTVAAGIRESLPRVMRAQNVPLLDRLNAAALLYADRFRSSANWQRVTGSCWRRNHGQ